MLWAGSFCKVTRISQTTSPLDPATYTESHNEHYENEKGALCQGQQGQRGSDGSHQNHLITQTKNALHHIS